MIKRIHIFITGRVQGVFFREFTVEEANTLGVVGWVRNLTNGEVEVLAEAENEKLRLFIEKLRQGPPGSKVESISGNEETATGEYKLFIKRN